MDEKLNKKSNKTREIFHPLLIFFVDVDPEKSLHNHVQQFHSTLDNEIR